MNQACLHKDDFLIDLTVVPKTRENFFIQAALAIYDERGKDAFMNLWIEPSKEIVFTSSIAMDRKRELKLQEKLLKLVQVRVEVLELQAIYRGIYADEKETEKA